MMSEKLVFTKNFKLQLSFSISLVFASYSWSCIILGLFRKSIKCWMCNGIQSNLDRRWYENQIAKIQNTSSILKSTLN